MVVIFPFLSVFNCLFSYTLCFFGLTRAVLYVLQHAYTDGHLEEPATVAVLHFHADNGSMDQQEISSWYSLLVFSI